MKRSVFLTFLLCAFLLTGCGQQVSRVDEDFLFAADRGSLSKMDVLLNEGANVNARDREGYTALMKASVWGADTVVKYLLDKNADTTLKNHGKTALDFAVTFKHHKIVSLLKGE